MPCIYNQLDPACGCMLTGLTEKMAESVVLRGGRRHGQTLSATDAAEALDAALMQEGARICACCAPAHSFAACDIPLSLLASWPSYTQVHVHVKQSVLMLPEHLTCLLVV